MLPADLQAAVEQELEHLDRRSVARAAEQISSNYKAGHFSGSLSSPESLAAYLITRLPATFAANSFVYREIARRMPSFAPRSFLDLGAGPGTSAWAAAEVWPSLQDVTFLESNRRLVEVGQRLARSNPLLSRATWLENDLRSAKFPSADIVILSYSAGELSDATAVIDRAWQATQELLVIIEPGTPKNFERVARWRSELIESGGHVVAPCPHQNACPMAVAGDWCHFAARLERTAEHRRLKGGSLGYEDEKFSYLAISKKPVSRPEARIVRHPMTYSGYIRLTLCTAEGLKEETVARSKKELFRAARRANWGDAWPQSE